MKGNDQHLANNEDGKNYVVEYPLAFKFLSELPRILNRKPEFEVPYNYYEVVHEDRLGPCRYGIQNSKPSCNIILEILIFCYE